VSIEQQTPVTEGGNIPWDTAPVRINALAIAAFASSFFIGVTGVILGFIALHQIKTTGERGRGLAIAALVVGCTYTAVFVYLTLALSSSEGTGGSQ
jgi:peptidyl-prolyl cis-trans isomerase B (cyclophilin B)